MADERIHRWRRDGVTVSWDRSLCIHVGECIRAGGDLFEMGRRPWCKLDDHDEARVREVVARCPSGALAVDVERAGDGGRGGAGGSNGDGRRDGVDARGGSDEAPPPANTVTVVDGGPLYFHGELVFGDAIDADSPGLARRAALCRCGRSGNKPWCDGSHAKAGFDEHGAVGDGRGATAPAETGGPLAIDVVRDGPLRVGGNLTIRAASGREAWRGTATALCRCGLSNDKPFCDGSHRREGWTEDG